MTEFTAEQLEAIAKVEKLMALAAGNANEHEAAAATDRANFILAKLNLSMDALAAASGSKDKGRKEDKLVGGFYQHERDLWKAIAELNFCFYSTVKVRYDAEKAKKENRQYAHHHRLIGRNINIIGSKLMADYLLQTLERLTKEFIAEERPYEKWHPRSSSAISFRKGAASRLIEKINAKRRQNVREERRKEEEAKANGSRGDGSSLVVSGLIKSEYEANYDFINGEGAYARAQANLANWEKKWAQEAEDARIKHEHLMATDEDYRRDYIRAERKAERDAQKRRERENNRSYREPKFKGDASAFVAGYRRADAVGLDQQIDKSEQGKLK